MSQTQALSFGGFDLGEYCLVKLERPVGPPLRASVTEVPGRAGDILLSAALDVMEVVAHCTLRPRWRHLWPQVRPLIAAALCAEGERALTLPDEPGLTRMATASLEGAVALPADGPVTFDVRFTMHDPVAFGATRTATVPSGGSVTFDVGGTRPTRPQISASVAVRDSRSLVWGLRLDEGDVVRVATGSSSSRSVAIDCAARTASVAGLAATITLDSDWFELSPGTHTIRMDQGTGKATVTWSERSV